MVVPSYDWEVFFDQPLVGGSVDPTNWWFWKGFARRIGLTAHVIGNRVFGMSGPAGYDPKPDHVDYNPPPFDVMNLDLTPADAFADYPLA